MTISRKNKTHKKKQRAGRAMPPLPPPNISHLFESQLELAQPEIQPLPQSKNININSEVIKKIKKCEIDSNDEYENYSIWILKEDLKPQFIQKMEENSNYAVAEADSGEFKVEDSTNNTILMIRLFIISNENDSKKYIFHLQPFKPGILDEFVNKIDEFIATTTSMQNGGKKRRTKTHKKSHKKLRNK
jgi:hypothetical protein